MIRTTQSEERIEHYIHRYDMANFLNDDLLRHLRLFHFPAYHHVYIEQDEQHFLYFLVEGMVQCSHYHLNGKLAVLALSTPFAAIGDLEILSEERVMSNVIATQETVMLGLARPVVHRYGADDPRFLRFLIREMRQKLYRTNLLQMNRVLPVTGRLVLYILSQMREDQGGAVTLPAKEDLASLLGTTPRHLNRVFKEMVETGAISSGYPRVHVLDQEALQNLTQ